MQLGESREMSLLTRLVCRRARWLFANSKYTAGLLEGAGVPQSKLCVIHPGVDTERFRPNVDGSSIRERFLPTGGLLLLSVGRLVRRKGFDLAIRAVSLLRSSFPNLRYLLVGEGPDRPYLETIIRDLGLGDIVELTGKVSDNDLPKYYSACDVFVHPNRIVGVDVEGFGIVFLEAASAGRPAIGGRNGGVPEAVEDGESGLLVGGEDVEELAGALKPLLDSSDRRRRMGGLARRRALERFSWQAAAARLIDVLD
jgi:phosphatidylinositol alpha-1,6-mannosyltransferase